MTNINNRCAHEEAKNVMNMGFSMINTIKAVRDRVNNSDLNMRIGIHTVFLNKYNNFVIYKI
jgi:hypothetical protein